MITIEQERAAFEVAADEAGYDIRTFNEGKSYRDARTHDVWIGWQLSRAQLAQQQEPVAYACASDIQCKESTFPVIREMYNDYDVALYTAPPATAQPAQVSDARILELLFEHGFGWHSIDGDKSYAADDVPAVDHLAFARALLAEQSK